GRERGGQWERRDALEPRPPRALAPRERRAVRARAQVCPELAALRLREAPVELPRERQLGLAARQRALELLAERAPGPEDEGRHGALGEPQDRRDLPVRAAVELAHHERGALVERQLAERLAEVLGRR